MRLEAVSTWVIRNLLIERQDLRRFKWVGIIFLALFAISMLVGLGTFVVIAAYVVISPAMLLIAAIGLVCAPFAAMVSWKAARKRRLKPGLYLVMGAMYSVAFLLPWLYLTARLRGNAFPPNAIRIGYFVLYATWLLGPISFWGTFVILAALDGFDYIGIAAYSAMTILFVIMSLAWIISLTNVLPRNYLELRPAPKLFVGFYAGPRSLIHEAPQTSKKNESVSGDGMLIRPRYSMPLVYALLSYATFYMPSLAEDFF